MRALLFRSRRNAGDRLALPGIDRGRVADHENLGMPGHGEVRFDLNAARTVGRNAEPNGGRRGANPRSPKNYFGGDFFLRRRSLLAWSSRSPQSQFSLRHPNV